MKTKLTILSVTLLLIAVSKSYGQKEITVNFDDTVGTLKDLFGGNLLFNNTIELLQYQGIKIIRSHDFHNSLDYSDYSDFWIYDSVNDTYLVNMSFNPEDTAYYHWQAADSVIAYIKENNFDIFFRIGISYPNTNPLPPYEPPYDSPDSTFSFTRFASLCKHVVMHYNDGWDNGRHDNIQYWEVWNEPGGLFLHGTPPQYYLMYKNVADSIKTYDPNLKVGGPGAVPLTSIGQQSVYREGFIEFCANNNIDLDFYSWHLYGYKNPYGIKKIADSIRTILDVNGFTSAENIISEINNDLHDNLDTFVTSPYGSAYYLSTVLTAQESSVDKLFWYPSCFDVRDRITGDTIITRTYYALKTYYAIQTSTPIIVQNDGSEVVNGNWDSYQTNFMVLTTKSADNTKFSITISNLQSNINNLSLNLNGLPFSYGDSLKITKHIISDNYVYHTEVSYIAGAPSVTLNNIECPNPGVLFLQIEKKNTTLNNLVNTENDVTITPNPTGNYVYVKSKYRIKNITVYNAKGIAIKSFNPLSNSYRLNTKNLNKGIYIFRITTNAGTSNIKVVKQ